MNYNSWWTSPAPYYTEKDILELMAAFEENPADPNHAVLRENLGISFMGDTKGGPFDIDADTARGLLASPNPDRHIKIILQL